MQVGKDAGDHAEDDELIANIQFGGPKVRRLADADDSSDGAGSATGAGDSAVDAAPQKEREAKHSSKGPKGKGKKSTASNSSVAEGTHKFQSSRKSVAASSSTGDVPEGDGGAEDVGVAGNATAADAPGSLLVSAIEAQARREAERVKAAAAGSTGTKIVAKHKKKRDKGGGEAAAAAGGDKKRKKHKSKEKSGGGSKKNGGVGAAAPAPAVAPAAAGAGAGGLGGLILLGSYASSSGSDGDAP